MRQSAEEAEARAVCAEQARAEMLEELKQERAEKSRLLSRLTEQASAPRNVRR